MPKGVYERKGFEERFWAKVDKRGPIPPHRPALGRCWVWLGPPGRGGYGQFWLEGENWKPHRISWLIKHGELTEMHLMHLCDNPACVRNSHLQEGSALENNSDRDTKGRTAKNGRGGRNKKGEAGAADVLKITDLFFDEGWSQDELAFCFERSQVNISQILRGATWPYLKRRTTPKPGMRWKK